ncbi:uncharacterized protein [Spinacia oleracea]|uniref:Reverse transcriptase zinc-binding domain-containing protein n=1 Tax=Spinacia oleracea TaxID=3562 RepID=A0ABM3R8S7_SPIOL|nr:uncharacterized protein LOC130467515 [Spinacia oleracea]
MVFAGFNFGFKFDFASGVKFVKAYNNKRQNQRYKKVLKLIQRACTTFLWTGSSIASRKALVAWDYLCLPKSSGGWKPTCMKTWNKAAIGKLLWNLAQKKDKAWVRWVHEYYIKGKNITLMNTPSQASWVVKKIFDSVKTLVGCPNGLSFLQSQSYSTRKVYSELRGYLPVTGYLNLVWSMTKLAAFATKRMKPFPTVFFSCEFSATIWNSVLYWFGVSRCSSSWHDELVFLQARFNKNTGLHQAYRMVLSISIYIIWRERNYRKFQKSYQDWQVLLKEIKVMAFTCSSLKQKVHLALP